MSIDFLFLDKLKFTVTLAFNQTYNPDLKDPSSAYYQETARMATNQLVKVVEELTYKIPDYRHINWIFSKGSIIATAENVIIDNATSPAKVLQEVAKFNQKLSSNKTTLSAPLKRVSFLAIRTKPTPGKIIYIATLGT